MVDKKELWIGDLLKVIKSGKIGKFEGVKEDGRFRVRLGDKVILIKDIYLEKIDEATRVKKEFEIREDVLKEKLGYKKTEQVIDLHIEKLNPNLLNSVPERIIDFQLKTFENYIENALKDRLHTFTIIHGKGTGVLKTSIQTFLNSVEEVNHFHLINNGGATEVFMKY